MRLIQINLNHCEAAQDLLSQTIYEKGIEAAIISEPYRNNKSGAWTADETGKAAIWACGNQAIQEVMEFPEVGFVRAKIAGIYIYSCYAPPSATITEFEGMLGMLVSDARSRNPKIIAGDFNAWAVDWGSRTTNTRGRILLEAFAELDLVLANTGNVSTFRGTGSGSIVDLTYVSTTLARRMTWFVSEHYTHSDHQAIFLQIEYGPCVDTCSREAGNRGWSVKGLEEDAFIEMLLGGQSPGGAATEKVEQMMGRITRACDAAMPRRRVLAKRRSNYWWNEEIAVLRNACFRARRICQRSRARPDFDEKRLAYVNLRGRLKQAIRTSKRECFKELCTEADQSPWGTAYRIVMKKMRGRTPQLTCPHLLLDIVTALFPPDKGERKQHKRALDVYTIPAVTEEELTQICRRIGDNKAPGLDAVPNRALKLAVKTRPDWFISVFETCMIEGVFPDRWKRQKLVLLPKPNKHPGHPSSYRPICLIDTAGKMLERVIYNRLLPIIEYKDGLSERQFGFRQAHSTIDAVDVVLKLARDAMSSKKCCAVVTLDIKNAFNSASWEWIKSSLAKTGVPSYLTKLLNSYLSERTLWYDTDEGSKQYTVTAGVPQGSVLGPLLWNVMYNGVLVLPVPKEATIIGFADDLAVVVVAKQPEDVEMYANETISAIKAWLEMVQLDLAEQKTEAVLITNRRKRNTINIRVGGHVITSKPVIKYLGVMIDAKINFKGHLDYACEKAANTSVSLARMMPNIGGPRYSRRLLVAGVVRSTLLYAAPVWEEALACESNRRRVNMTYRLVALRVCSAFRTISGEAACVIAGMIPIDILASETRCLYETRKMNPLEKDAECRKAARRESLEKWQKRWDDSQRGRWTHTLIPRIEEWIQRRHGEINYHLTQFLSGHGGYRKYLHQFRLDDSPLCPECGCTPEDPEHVMFHCPRFLSERRSLEDSLKTTLSPQNIVGEMLKSEGNWCAVNTAIKRIQEELGRAERARRTRRTEGVVA